jgi:hypothetical protein
MCGNKKWVIIRSTSVRQNKKKCPSLVIALTARKLAKMQQFKVVASVPLFLLLAVDEVMYQVRRLVLNMKINHENEIDMACSTK